MWRDEFFEHEGDKDWWHKHDWMEFPIEKDLWEKADEYIMVLIRAHTLFPCEKAKSVRLNEY